ncbi:hypothetical protein [Streptomyces bacillaris]
MLPRRLAGKGEHGLVRAYFGDQGGELAVVQFDGVGIAVHPL